ncbi:MAG TPA: PKD domain-containing protein [Thermoplasmata archaeon]|nr:PKD domain-containing protein [Thermoplasmata archaeon]
MSPPGASARRRRLALESALLVLLLVLGSCVWVPSARASVAPSPAGHGPSPASPVGGHPATALALQSAPTSVARPLAAMTLSSPGADPSAVILQWTATTSLTFSSYTVLYSTNGSTGPWASAGVVTAQATTTFAASGLSPGTEYWWEIAENDAVFPTQYSNILPVVQPTLAFLTSSFLTASDVQLNWTNNATYGGPLTFESYLLYEVVGTAEASLAATVTNVSTRTATVTGLSSGSSYLFYLYTTDCLSGCGGGGPTLAQSESNSVTIGTPLPLSASVTPLRNAVDVGQQDLFTCTPSGGQSPYRFAWDLGNGSYVPGSGSIATSFSSPGPAVVTCRITDNRSTVVTNAVTITVAVDPVVDLVVSRSIAEAGQSIVFNCTPSLGLSPYSTQWVYGDGTGDSTALAVHGYSAAGRFVATCTASDTTGTQASGHVTITIDPAVAVTVTANSTAAAPRTNLTFAAQPVNGSGVYQTYNWSFGDGTVVNGTAPTTTHAFSGVGNFSVSADVVDTLGGSARASTTVVVSAIAVSLGSFPTSATSGNLVDFSASAQGGAGAPYRFTWEFGDGTGTSGAHVNHSYAADGSFVPHLTVTDRLGSSTTVTLASIQVSPPPPPVPLIGPEVLLLLAILLGAMGAVILEWRHRRVSDRAYPALAGRVPAADPARLVRGRRVCRMCGHPNLGIRETCEACGASLRRSPPQ